MWKKAIVYTTRNEKKEQDHIRDLVWAVQGKPKNELGSLKSGNLGCLAVVTVQCVFCRVVHIIGKALIGVLRPPHSPPPPLLSTEQHLNSYRKFWVATRDTLPKMCLFVCFKGMADSMPVAWQTCLYLQSFPWPWYPSMDSSDRHTVHRRPFLVLSSIWILIGSFGYSLWHSQDFSWKPWSFWQYVFCCVVHIIEKAMIGVLRRPHSPPPPLLSTEQHLNSTKKFC